MQKKKMSHIIDVITKIKIDHLKIKIVLLKLKLYAAMKQIVIRLMIDKHC